MKDVLFFEEFMQVTYHYVKDLLGLSTFSSSWPHQTDGLLFMIFLHLWIRLTLDLRFEQPDRRTSYLLNITGKTDVVRTS